MPVVKAIHTVIGFSVVSCRVVTVGLKGLLSAAISSNGSKYLFFHSLVSGLDSLAVTVLLMKP